MKDIKTMRYQFESEENADGGYAFLEVSTTNLAPEIAGKVIEAAVEAEMHIKKIIAG